MRRTLALILWTLGSLFMTALVRADDVYNFDQITAYYAKASGGLITPSSGNWSDLQFVFSNSDRWNKILMPPKLIHDVIYREQDAFHLDIEGFIAKQEASDFLEAKYMFYQALEFSTAQQMHERPYYYLYSWGSLFYPPIKQLSLPRERYSKFFKPQDLTKRQSVYFDPEFQKNIDSMTDTQLTMGNKLRMLNNGVDSYPEKLRLIRQAKQFFLGSALVYLCDDSTKALVDEMAAARKRGVDVKIMVEGTASILDNGCNDRMRKAGVDLLVISDVMEDGSRFGVMHNKLWIRDGEEAIMGGENVLNAENYSDGFNFRNRDADVLIKDGPAITDLTREYIGLWDERRDPNQNGALYPYLTKVYQRMEQEKASHQRGRKFYDEWLSNPQTRMNGICRVAVQPSGADSHPISPIIYEYIRRAKESVFFDSPTIEYNNKEKGQEREDWNTLLKELIVQKANEDGVKFEIVSNGFEGGNGEVATMARELYEKYQTKGIPILAGLFHNIQFMFSNDSARDNRANLLELSHQRNIETYTYLGYVHSKTFVFDRLATAIGSYNFDLFSSERSYETQMFCLDKDFLQQVEDAILLDLVNSVPVTSLFDK